MKVKFVLLLIAAALIVLTLNLEAKQRKGKKLGPAKEDEVVHFTVAHPSPNEAELDQFLAELYDPKSQNYQKFVSVEEFTVRFGPKNEHLQKTKEFLREHHLEFISVSKNNILLEAKGKVRDLTNAFNCQIHYYQDNEDGSVFRDTDVPPQIPSWTLAVVGLKNSTYYTRQKFRPLNVPNAHSPSDIHRIYDIPSTYKGNGQTIAVVEYDNFVESDVTSYAQQYGLPTPKVQRIYVNNACNVCCDSTGQNCVSCQCTVAAPTTPGSGQAEVTLDIELALAIAPEATVLVYIAANIFTLSVINQIAVDNKASVVSTSWGLPEDSFIPGSAGELVAESLIYKQWAAQGQSNYVAAGDSGAIVDDPASQPYSTSVGGTTLSVNANGSYLSETTWWDGSSGGGGGISQYWAIPSYQVGVISSSSLGSTKMRNVPDISFDADPNTGYNIYVQGSFQVYGGTSCAAPIWAGFTALVNNYRSVSLNAGRIGFVNPVLYSLGKRSDYNYYFHDIKDGSTNGHYPAVSGYDLATGWGTIKGQALLVGMGGCPQGQYLSNGNCVTAVTSAPVLSGTPRPTLRTNVPTVKATQSPVSTAKPTIKTSSPTIKATQSPVSTAKPTLKTSSPTIKVTAKPTAQTNAPVMQVTAKPTIRTQSPTIKATSKPTVKTNVPTVKITNRPSTNTPTKQVTTKPTFSQTNKPTLRQTNKPSVQPIQPKTSSPTLIEYEYRIVG